MSEFKPVILTLSEGLTPSLVMEVLPYGLTIHKLLVQVDGRTHDIVIGPEAPEDHVTQKYTNTVVGRYANRIPVGTHTLERHGITSQFTAVANENPRVSLHGGPVGFDALPWSLLSSETPPSLFTSTELANLARSNAESHAIFRLISEDGDQGYPGQLIVEALVALVGHNDPKSEEKYPIDDSGFYELGSVLLIYRAKLAERSVKTVTPVNLTQHWGFNLEASLKEGVDPLSVKEHVLTIEADHIVERDVDSLATGAFLPVSEVPAHAHSNKKIGDLLPEAGYDDYYLFKKASNSSIPTRLPLSSLNLQSDLLKDVVRPSGAVGQEGRGTRPNSVVELFSDKSGIKLTFDTNQDGVMFYSNSLAHPSKGARKKIHGGSGISGHGDAYGFGTAAFLEFHDPLTAFLDPKNKGGEDTLLTSDELYHNYVRCDVKFKVPRR